MWLCASLTNHTKDAIEDDTHKTDTNKPTKVEAAFIGGFVDGRLI